MSNISKFLVAVATAVVVAAQSYINGGDNSVSWDEWVQIAVVGFAAADVWLTANIPGARAAKAVVLAAGAALAMVASYAANGGDLGSVHWWNVALAAVGAGIVYLVPNGALAPAPAQA